MQRPINIFIIYAREDREIKQRLLVHLNPLKYAFNAVIWHDEFIEAGQEWKPHIESRLEQTDLFLLLVSSDFMNSRFISQVEFKYAIDRHNSKKSIVIPIIINYCLWDIDINLSKLQVLPNEAKPIDDWKTPDQAYNNIASGIRTVLSTIKNNREEKEHNLEIEKNRKEIEENQRQNNIKEKEKEKLEKEKLERERLETEKYETADNNDTQPDNPIISKKSIYFSIVLLIAILLGFFIFHKRNSSESGKSDKAKSQKDINLFFDGTKITSDNNTLYYFPNNITASEANGTLKMMDSAYIRNILTDSIQAVVQKFHDTAIFIFAMFNKEQFTPAVSYPIKYFGGLLSKNVFKNQSVSIRVYIDKTNIGSYLFHDDGGKTATPAVLDIYSQGKMTIHSYYNYKYDLDQGKEKPYETKSDMDFYWGHPTSMRFTLFPISGEFCILGKKNFSEIDAHTLAKVTYSKKSIETEQLTKGTVVAVRTKQGRFCKFRIDKYEYDELSLTWITYK